MRVAIIGANGSVGSEVSLLLARRPGVEVVPVCRNRLGSAFLRWRGLACRHGRAAEPVEAPALIGDCDVVANFALPGGTPREAHEATVRLVTASIRHSPPGARIIFFSTLNVYGDPYPGARIRWKNAYARQKLRGERLALRLGRALGREVWVLRLGHVTGDLQGISLMLRDGLRAGPLYLPAPEAPSNTTHVASIADAILAIGAGRLTPGLYDLPNAPQWTWREVIEFEATRAGLEPGIDAQAPAGPATLARRLLATVLRIANSSPALRQQGLQVLARFSPDLNLRLQASNARARAAAEIAALTPRQPLTDAMRWRAVGRHFAPDLALTRELTADAAWLTGDAAAGRPWPADLPPATLARRGAGVPRSP